MKLYSFYLVYRGKLKANGTAKHKQDIRRQFHKQLFEFWQQTAIGKSIPLSLGVPFETFTFFPLITKGRNETAELQIIILRPGAPGHIVYQGGDVDNCLKTLLDALKIPDKNQIVNDSPQEGESPFFCLLEDDILISKLSVSVDRLLLLEPNDPDFVHLLIHVTKRQFSEPGREMQLTF